MKLMRKLNYLFTLMGCMSSKPNEIQSPKKRVDNINDLRVTHSEMVGEKSGKINNDYSLLSPPLGKGAFGEVRKAVHKITRQTRAVKIISKAATNQEDQEKLKDEVNILKTLDHPNIIKVFEFYQDSRNFYIVTELCTGGELFDKIINEKSFSERKAAETMKQVLSAVLYCHENNIVHRDLKPENLLYESSKPGSAIKVVDFGTSRLFDPDKKMSQKIGTPYYIAPEVLDNNYDEKCDIWSCGVILFILLSGSPPFNGVSDQDILRSVKRGQYKLEDEEWANISKEAKTLLAKMLTKDQDPRERISAKDAINDPWIQTYCKKPEVDLPQLAKSLQNMRNFHVSKKFQEAALVFMVNFLASKEEKNELLKQFQSLDLNNDGKLSREELIIGYKKVLNEAEAEEEVDRIMNAVDKNQSGAIDYSGIIIINNQEFVLATINREALMEQERLQMAFKLFDKDGSGSISTDEIKTIFGQNSQIADSVWQELIKEVDQNSDGQISYQEFRDMMVLKVQNAKAQP